MSIVTKTGDEGTTALMYGRRVAKCDPRVSAYGAVDELNSALGLARASAAGPAMKESLLAIQKELVTVMGELATAIEDLPRYIEGGFKVVEPGLTARLEAEIKSLEARDIALRGWAMPGNTPAAAALDFARTVCRRAERSICELRLAGHSQNPNILIYLNRLSDLLWLMARAAEKADASA